MKRNYKPVPAFSFDWLTPLYDPITELIGFGTSFKERVLQMLNLKDGESILDVGCGTGSLLVPAKVNYPHSRVVGIDPDPQVLRITERKINRNNLKIELKQAWGEELPFPDSAFNVVVSTLVLHHVPSGAKIKIIKEVYRILKHDGRFMLADFGKPHNKVWKVILWLEGIFEEAKYMKDNLEGRIPVFLEENGFRVKEISPRYRGVQFLLGTKKV